jgi:hypothetical protein
LDYQAKSLCYWGAKKKKNSSIKTYIYAILMGYYLKFCSRKRRGMGTYIPLLLSLLSTMAPLSAMYKRPRLTLHSHGREPIDLTMWPTITDHDVALAQSSDTKKNVLTAELAQQQAKRDHEKANTQKFKEQLKSLTK